jgi:hypothetical protein
MNLLADQDELAAEQEELRERPWLAVAQKELWEAYGKRPFSWMDTRRTEPKRKVGRGGY